MLVLCTVVWVIVNLFHRWPRIWSDYCSNNRDIFSSNVINELTVCLHTINSTTVARSRARSANLFQALSHIKPELIWWNWFVSVWISFFWNIMVIFGFPILFNIVCLLVFQHSFSKNAFKVNIGLTRVIIYSNTSFTCIHVGFFLF